MGFKKLSKMSMLFALVFTCMNAALAGVDGPQSRQNLGRVKVYFGGRILQGQLAGTVVHSNVMGARLVKNPQIDIPKIATGGLPVSIPLVGSNSQKYAHINPCQLIGNQFRSTRYENSAVHLPSTTGKVAYFIDNSSVQVIEADPSYRVLSHLHCVD